MKENKCLVKGCNRPVKVQKHGLCMAHVLRYYRTGSVGDAEIHTRKEHKVYQQPVERKQQ